MHRFSLQIRCTPARGSRPAGGTGRGRPAWQRWLVILGAVAALGYPALAAQPVQARTAPPSPPAAQPPPPPQEFLLVPSAFNDDPKSSRDPFYPNSARLAPRQTTNAVVAALPDLVLKGIAVTPNQRLAMINNSTLAQGEEAEIRAGGKIYKIRCLEVREQAVVISYKGLTKELALRKGF